MQQVGDFLKTLAPVKKALKEAPPLTASGQKLLDAASAIRLDPDAVERAFMARQLVQCTLPHSNPGNVERWLRRNGNLALVIRPGWDTRKDCSLGYPYGSIPRLLLFWVITEAVQTKSRRLQLGRSLAAFIRQVGLNPDTGGGKRSDAKRLREQMQRLFRCHISFDQVVSDTDGTEGSRWRDMQVAPEGELWWDVKRPEQFGLFNSWIELGEKFFAAVTAAPVPADMRALRALRRSPLALDLYAWATYRAFSVSRKGAPQFVPWYGLMRQMGCDYDDVSNFKKKANKALRKVRAVYPALKIKSRAGGFDILPCPPAVPPALAART
jgi:hypothetical protein